MCKPINSHTPNPTRLSPSLKLLKHSRCNLSLHGFRSSNECLMRNLFMAFKIATSTDSSRHKPGQPYLRSIHVLLHSEECSFLAKRNDFCSRASASLTIGSFIRNTRGKKSNSCSPMMRSPQHQHPPLHSYFSFLFSISPPCPSDQAGLYIGYDPIGLDASGLSPSLVSK